MAGVLLVFASQSSALVTAGADGDQLRTRLAQFRVAEGEFPEALATLDALESPLAQILRAESLVATGRTAQAVPILQGLTQGDWYRGRAWLLLAEAGMNGLAPGDTALALDNAVRYGNGEIRERARFYQVEALRSDARPERAGQILATMTPGYWSAVGYQNVASDYASADRSPARSLVALRVALALAGEDRLAPRAASLRSELLLQAGYLAYLSEDFEKAESFLKDVALDSYITPEALHLHGLAQAGRHNFREAMQSWHRARKFPMALPGVAEAWLLMGRGYEELGYPGQAGEALLAAIAAFDSEQVAVKSLADQVRQQGTWKAMVEASRLSDLEWFLADNRSLAQPRRAYLLRFSETPEGQAAIARVATLEQLLRQLEVHTADLGIYHRSLDDLHDSLPLQADLEHAQNRFREQGGQLADRTRTLMTTAASQDQARLDGLGTTLAEIHAAYQTLAGQRAQVEGVLNTRRAHLTALANRLVALRERLIRTRSESERVLDQQMTEFLQHQDARLGFARDRAEQQVAYLYEDLARRGLEQGGAQ